MQLSQRQSPASEAVGIPAARLRHHMADSARGPSIGLTTWFYAAPASENLIRIDRVRAGRILGRGAVSKPRVPLDWQDHNRGLTLIGVGLVSRRGRPIYAERCAVSFHRLTSTSGAAVPRWPDFETLAARISSDCETRYPNVEGLARFLAANSQRPLLEDLYLLLQTGRSRLDDLWLDHLLAGFQTSYLWDLRTNSLHPPRTPLRIGPARCQGSRPESV
jgi:hypothetical protein